jgi:hypothetical protein
MLNVLLSGSKERLPRHVSFDIMLNMMHDDGKRSTFFPSTQVNTCAVMLHYAPSWHMYVLPSEHSLLDHFVTYVQLLTSSSVILNLE